MLKEENLANNTALTKSLLFISIFCSRLWFEIASETQLHYQRAACGTTLAQSESGGEKKQEEALLIQAPEISDRTRNIFPYFENQL